MPRKNRTSFERLVYVTGICSVFWLLGCSPPLSQEEALLITLRNLARSDLSQACNPSILEKEIHIRFEKLPTPVDTATQATDSLDTARINAAPAGPEIKRAWFRLWRKGPSAGCMLQVEYVDLKICNFFMPKTQSMMGTETMSVGPPLDAPQLGYTYGYRFKQESGIETQLWFESEPGACPRKFSFIAER